MAILNGTVISLRLETTEHNNANSATTTESSE